MAIQNRRGVYSDFTPTKMVPGELAVVQSGDPNNSSGKAVYAAFGTSGDVKRLATEDDLSKKVDKETGKGLSTNDFTTAEKNKLSGIEAQANKTVIDATLTQTGKAADAKAVGDAIAGVTIETDKTLSITDAPADAKVVGDELANVKSDLESGNLNQSIKVSPFVTGTDKGELRPVRSTLSVTGNSLQANWKGSSVSFGFYSTFEDTAVRNNAGHKIYYNIHGAQQHCANFIRFRFQFWNNGSAVGDKIDFTGQNAEGIAELSVSADQIALLCSSGASTSDYFTLEYVQIIDLTRMFGVGNEPSIDAFKEVYGAGMPYPFKDPSVFISYNDEKILINNAMTEAVKYLGDMSTLGYTAFSEITDVGYVLFTSDYVATIQDKPTDLIADGICINYAATGQRFQSLQSNGKLWIRNITQGGIASEWLSLILPFDVDDAMLYIGSQSTLNYTSFADISVTGYFNFVTSRISDFSDKPNDLTLGGICVNYNALAGRFQILQSSGNIWIRNITSGGSASRWISLVKPYDVNWYALGDSLTYGTYSEIGSATGVGRTNNNYVALVSKYNGYTVTNLGEGGMGYLHAGNTTSKTAKDVVDENSFSDADLITLAFGINDWGHFNFGTANDAITDNTVCGAMKYCIEKIMEKRPACKVVVITPFNCFRHGGTYETNWALGYDRGYGTLQNLIDAIKSVCDFYGVQYLDMTKIGPVNRQNIATLLGDGLHPTIDGYAVIAKTIRKAVPI